MPNDSTIERNRALLSQEHPWGDASWDTPYSPQVWEQLLQLSAEPVRGSAARKEEEGRRRIQVGPVLVDEQDDRIGLLSVRRRTRPSGEGLRWLLEVKHKPASAPPLSIIRQSQQLGGRRGLVDNLRSLLTAENTTVAEHEINFLMDEEEWKCRLVPRSLDPGLDTSLLELSPSAQIESIGYRLPEGAQGVHELTLTYLHQQRLYHVTARARGVLKLDPDRWLPFADEVRALLVAKVFFPVEDRP